MLNISTHLQLFSDQILFVFAIYVKLNPCKKNKLRFFQKMMILVWIFLKIVVT